MMTASAELRQRYQGALAAYLEASGSDAELVAAGDLGRVALDEGCGLVDLVSLHAMVLQIVIGGLPCGPAVGPFVSKAEDFLTQVVAPFEMTHRGWHEVVGRLRQLNETLEQQVE